MMSKCRANFHSDSENIINKQIHMELTASYIYLQFASYFKRDSIALHGFAKFFDKSSKEEQEHADKLIDYMVKRGGKVQFKEINELIGMNGFTPLSALEAALSLELKVYNSLLEVHKVGENVEDSQLCDFIESEYLSEQVDAHKEIADMITRLELAGDGLGTYLFDKELLEKLN